MCKNCCASSARAVYANRCGAFTRMNSLNAAHGAGTGIDAGCGQRGICMAVRPRTGAAGSMGDCPRGPTLRKEKDAWAMLKECGGPSGEKLVESS